MYYIYFFIIKWWSRISFVLLISLFPLGIGATIFLILNFKEYWYIGSLVMTTGLFFIIFYWFWSKRIVTLSITSGLKIKNDENKNIYLNIYYKRELFSQKEFNEYKKYYVNFYKKIERRIDDQNV